MECDMQYDKSERLYKCRRSERFSHLRDIHNVSLDILYNPVFVNSMYLLYADYLK